MNNSPSAQLDLNQLAALLYRIDNLEVKVSFLDDTVEQLNTVVAEQSNLIDALYKQIKVMHAKLTSVSENAELAVFDPGAEVPPHF